MKYKFTDSEVGKILRNMVVLVDSREQKNDHVIEYFKKHKIAYKQEKLDLGDYSCMIPKGTFEGQDRDVYFTNDVVVERKASIYELIGNLKDKSTNINQIKMDKVKEISKEYGSKYLEKILRSDYNRLKHELTTINKYGIKFFILVEDYLFDKHIHSKSFIEKFSQYDPDTLRKRLVGLQSEFNTVIVPVAEEYSGEKIYEYLKYSIRAIFLHSGFNPYKYELIDEEFKEALEEPLNELEGTLKNSGVKVEYDEDINF